MRVIGLTGGLGSGKDSWGNFLSEHFYGAHESTSQVAREHYLNSYGHEPSRDEVREASTLLRKNEGETYLVKTAFERAHRIGSELIIISGLYVPAEADYIRGQSGKIVHIKAPDFLRFERARLRARVGESVEDKELNRLDRNDMKSPLTDQRMEEVISGADYEIDGSAPIKEIERCLVIARTMIKDLYEQ
jgi:dephospho-CoA kinase